MAKSSRIRPLSADCTPRTNSLSMFLSLLPSVVQSRLPRMPSLRRHSKSMDGGWDGSRRSSISAPGFGSRTPCAGVDNAMVLSSAYFTDYMGEGENSTPSKDDKRTQLIADEKTAVEWKFANQGLNLLSLAVDESSSTNARYGDGGFGRQLYIHSLTYLLRALPPDMTVEEQLSIRSALPLGISEPLRLSPKTSEPSLLHRTLASSIVQLCILFQFVLPYMKYMLSAAYQYEREHKISDKVLSQGIETVDIVGKRGVGLAGVILGMGDGRVGKLVTYTTSWFVEGVTGGIHEGIGEGLVILDAKKSTLDVDR